MSGKNLFSKIALGVVLILQMNVSAAGSGRESGGGDVYVQDFALQATRAYDWLKVHSDQLHPKVNPELFLVTVHDAVAAGKIQSTDDPMVWKGVPKDAIFVASQDVTYLIRGRYSLDGSDAQVAARIRLAAHEIFRRMGLEGDNYELSNQMNVEDAYRVEIEKTKLEAWLGGSTLTCKNNAGREVVSMKVSDQKLSVVAIDEEDDPRFEKLFDQSQINQLQVGPVILMILGTYHHASDEGDMLLLIPGSFMTYRGSKADGFPVLKRASAATLVMYFDGYDVPASQIQIECQLQSGILISARPSDSGRD